MSAMFTTIVSTKDGYRAMKKGRMAVSRLDDPSQPEFWGRMAKGQFNPHAHKPSMGHPPYFGERSRTHARCLITTLAAEMARTGPTMDTQTPRAASIVASKYAATRATTMANKASMTLILRPHGRRRMTHVRPPTLIPKIPAIIRLTTNSTSAPVLPIISDPSCRLRTCSRKCPHCRFSASC